MPASAMRTRWRRSACSRPAPTGSPICGSRVIVSSARSSRAAALRRRREAAREDRAEDTITRLPQMGEPVGAGLEQAERRHLVRMALAGISVRCKRLLEALYYEDPTPTYGALSQRLGVP